MKVDLHANEIVIKAADSLFYLNEIKVLGKLILTNQRICFTTVNDRDNVMKLELEPDYIREVYNFRNRVLFPNGLCLLTRDGREWKFELKGRNQWAAMIARTI
jgi:hypothetical protein